MGKQSLRKDLLQAMQEAESKAWKSLRGYKFVMFGYWAGVWVDLNRAGGFRQPNPFRKVVKIANG